MRIKVVSKIDINITNAPGQLLVTRIAGSVGAAGEVGA